jgi:hypothetical protein
MVVADKLVSQSQTSKFSQRWRRLMVVADKLVSQSQTAFVLGRNIMEGVVILDA